MKLVRKLPDDTKKLISDAIKSDSAPISCKDAKKKKGKKGVAKAAAVNAHAAGSLAGVELFVNTLNSGPMAAIAVVDAWGYDGDHDLRGNDLRFLMAMICAIDKSVIPKSIVPGVPDYFFLSDTGSGVHLGWGRDCCVKRLASHIMIFGSGWSDVSDYGSRLACLACASFSQQFCLGYEVSYVRRFRCLY